MAPEQHGAIAAPHTRVAIIGSGFSGLGMGIRLKEEGRDDFRIFEKEGGIGGTWRVNHYPGCACDVQSHLYSFSFEPNTGLGHNSMVCMIESQIQYALDALMTMEKRGLDWVDVKSRKQIQYNRRLQSRLDGSIWTDGECTSWYLHPETGKNVALWPDFTFRFAQQTCRFDPAAYKWGGHGEQAAPRAPSITTHREQEALA